MNPFTPEMIGKVVRVTATKSKGAGRVHPPDSVAVGVLAGYVTFHTQIRFQFNYTVASGIYDLNDYDLTAEVL